MAGKKLRGKPDASAVTPALGTTGLKQYGGYVREEFLRDLQGPKGIRAYAEMGSNSAVIGSGLGVGRLIASRVRWEVEPYSQDAEDVLRAEFFQSCMDDMAHSWASLIRSAFSMIQFGFAPHEIVLKQRDGMASKHSDGLIGWAALPLRPQDSLKRWVFDESGRWTAMVQQGQSDTKERTLPRTKLLNFRPRDDKDNPEGVSSLRMVYFTYYWWKKMQEIEGIGVERSIAGLPVMGIPATSIVEGGDVYEKAKEIVQNLRNDADAGVVLPKEYQDGQPLYTLELLSASGSSLPDTSKIIERLDRRMAQALGTDFMLLGHEGVGSYALGDSKIDSFELAVEGYLDLISEPINHILIPLTMRVNGWDAERAPKLKHCPLEKADLGRLGDYVSKMISAQVITPDDDLEQHMRGQADLPPRNPAQPKREPPMSTGTKPEGGKPDAPKPPESKPTKEEQAHEEHAPVLVSEMEAARRRRWAAAEVAEAAAAVVAGQERAQLIEALTRPQVAPVVNVDVKPTPILVETAAPAITVQAPPPERKRRSRKVKFERNNAGVVIGADIEERD